MQTWSGSPDCPPSYLASAHSAVGSPAEHQLYICWRAQAQCYENQERDGITMHWKNEKESLGLLAMRKGASR